MVETWLLSCVSCVSSVIWQSAGGRKFFESKNFDGIILGIITAGIIHQFICDAADAQGRRVKSLRRGRRSPTLNSLPCSANWFSTIDDFPQAQVQQGRCHFR
jgi:hypothetical protein